MGRPHLRLDWNMPPPPTPLPPGVTVRGVAAEDAEAVGRVLWVAEEGLATRDFADEAEARAEAADTLNGKWGEVLWPSSLIAFVAGQAVAVALVVFDNHHDGLPLLAFVATVPQWQRRGIGSALITHSLPGVQAAGWHELHLAVVEGNPARLLYERLGFVLVP